MPRQGREFEKAVYTFVEALDPEAEVIFDHKVPDIDTGDPRQCDCWINTKFGRHIPLSILVSCKDKKKSKRKLAVGDIEQFCSEIASTGANIGVIYTNVGFTELAQNKAIAKNIKCCRLYESEPPDIPNNLKWFEYFFCKLIIRLDLKINLQTSEFKTWNDLFNLIVDDNKTVLDIISERFLDGYKQHIGLRHKLFPLDWNNEIELIEQKIQIQIICKWKKYKAQTQASLIDGSYCLSNQSFIGSQTSPEVNVKGNHPGENWEEIKEKNFDLPSKHILIISPSKLDLKSLKSILHKKYGDQSLNS